MYTELLLHSCTVWYTRGGSYFAGEPGNRTMEKSARKNTGQSAMHHTMNWIPAGHDDVPDSEQRDLLIPCWMVSTTAYDSSTWAFASAGIGGASDVTRPTNDWLTSRRAGRGGPSAPS